ncbi:MAG: CapA family protein [Acidobacteria bacterium]|nr:CapA family protein [Acidobacteriota bacterium]
MAGEWRVGLLGHYWNLRLGADVVIGHHPHIIQPFEIHRGCPIFYSVGNFTFGSRNSRAEGLLIGTRFEESQNLVNTYPLYVKNRDPRVNYHWRIFRGQRAVTSKSRGDAESFTSTVHL